MGLQVGEQLGPYRIVAAIGAGGMGEVYRARDRKLDREIAIKVLPEQLARDPERVSRFELEAKVLASLNHPNIAAIHGFEESGDKHFLVLELVEGETLAQRLHVGALPVDEAMVICQQIAAGLESAHEHGVIHRDLKPANVKVMPDGKVKVLDFGLAKVFSADLPAGGMASSPTITVLHTRPGVLLGTAAYMSPEQARGKAVDKRTDVWSFGVVLYECLSGQRPFGGETNSDVIARILQQDPDWGALPLKTPPIIRLLLQQCLAKDRNQRLHDIGDARIDLDNAISDPTSSSFYATAEAAGMATKGRTPRPWRLAILGLVALLAIIVVSVLATRESQSLHDHPAARLIVPLRGAAPLFGSLAIAPDGQFIVYRTESDGGVSHLAVRRLDEFGERLLNDTEGGNAPFISPDGQSIGFFTPQDLRRMSPAGASSQRICEASVDSLGAWGPDGTIVFSAVRTDGDALSGLSRVRASGGVPEILTTIDPVKNERSHGWPEFLPDGKHVLFTIGGEKFERIAILSLETRQYNVLLESASQPHYVPTGHLVFYDATVLKVFAVPFDAATRRVTGQRIEVLSDPTRQVVVSRNGTLAYIPLQIASGNSVVLVDRHGTATALFEQPGSWVEPRFSPNGRKVVLRQVQSPNCFLWLYDLDRSVLTRLTIEGDSHSPAWSADGEYVFTGLEGKVIRSLYRIPIDSSAPPNLLWKGVGQVFPGSGPADGSRVPFVDEAPQTGADIWVLSLKGETKAEPFVHTRFQEASPSFSPDGKWLAYSSDESGREEVYVRPYPGPGGKALVSTEGGSGPLWSQDGKELFYAHLNTMMAVDVITEPVFTPAVPHKLFDGEYAWEHQLNYDIAPDGQHFVIIKLQRNTSLNQELHVVLNWFEELKAKVPSNTS